MLNHFWPRLRACLFFAPFFCLALLLLGAAAAAAGEGAKAGAGAEGGLEKGLEEGYARSVFVKKLPLATTGAELVGALEVGGLGCVCVYMYVRVGGAAGG